MRTKIVLAGLVAVLLIAPWTLFSAKFDMQNRTDLQISEPTSVDKSVMAWDISKGLSMTWNRTYSGSAHDYHAYDAVLDERGCVVAGSVWLSGPEVDFLLKCISFSSGELWSYTYGDVGIDSCSAMLDIGTSGFLMVGSRAGFETSGYDIKVVRVNNNGGLQWNETYGIGFSHDDAQSVVLCDNSDFLICGDLLRLDPISNDALILRISDSGAYLWNETYGGDGDDTFWDIVKCSTGGYVMAGTTESYGEGLSDVWLVKIDEAGVLLWNKTYGGAGLDQGRALIECSNGDFVITGSHTLEGASTTDLLIVRTDPSGNMLWNRTFGGPNSDFGNGIYEDEEQQLVVCGTTYIDGGNSDLLLVMIDSAGELSWSQSYGGSQNDAGQFVLKRPNSYLFGGYMRSYSPSNNDEVWLLQAVPSPFWTIEPQDQTCELGYYHHFYANFTTPGQAHMSAWTNDSRVDIYFGLIFSSIDVSISTLAVTDEYGVLLTLRDSFGAILTGAFSVIVRDTTPPEFTGYDMGEDPGILDPWPSDNTFHIIRNGSIMTNPWIWFAVHDLSEVTNWTLSGTGSAYFRLEDPSTSSYSGDYVVRLVPVSDHPNYTLPPSGAYELTITATDPYENSVSADIIVVIDTFPRGPQILFPELLFVVGVGIMVIVIFLVYRAARSRAAG